MLVVVVVVVVIVVAVLVAVVVLVAEVVRVNVIENEDRGSINPLFSIFQKWGQ